MKKYNWIYPINVTLWILKCVGLWPEKFYTYNLYTLYAIFLAIAIVGGHNLSQIINIFFVYSDLEALTATIFVLSTNILATIKMCFFVRNLVVIKQLLAVLDNEQFQPKSTHQINLLKPSLKLWKVTFTIFHITVASNLVLWSTSPLLNEDQQLPFLAWYPFNIKTPLNYHVVYIYQVTCIWYVTAANISLDTMTYAFLMYIWSQCDLLCDDLSNLHGTIAVFKSNLIGCINHHKEIVRFANKSNSLFNIVILGQFITSTLVLALTLFQLSLVETYISQETLPHFCYLTGISMQLLLYCWFGNEVKIKSSAIPFSLYKSAWYHQPISVKKNMLILSIRCQEPINIKAINLFALSLRTFVGILRSAWSYFALLYNVNNS